MYFDVDLSLYHLVSHYCVIQCDWEKACLLFSVFTFVWSTNPFSSVNSVQKASMVLDLRSSEQGAGPRKCYARLQIQ